MMNNENEKLSRSFYEREDVVQVSRDLLGKYLCTSINGITTAGMITETEAYCGRNDKACHANNGLRTERTKTMYLRGGHAYVYLCYGIHHLFNVVTNREGLADAVLIRGVEPVEGIPVMMERRGHSKESQKISSGPGMLTSALGIRIAHDGFDLLGNTIWLKDRKVEIPDSGIGTSERIGVEYAGEHARRNWRFYLKNSDFVSR